MKHIAAMLFVLANVGFGQSIPTAEHTEDFNIRVLIKKFSDLRNAHDGSGVGALYSEDAELFSGPYSVLRGRQALSKHWANMPGRMNRAVQSIDLLGGSLAIVRVEGHTDYTEAAAILEPPLQFSEVFILVKKNGLWEIRIQQQLP
jgi:ketosteroid isomerase-like protein